MELDEAVRTMTHWDPYPGGDRLHEAAQELLRFTKKLAQYHAQYVITSQEQRLLMEEIRAAGLLPREEG